MITLVLKNICCYSKGNIESVWICTADTVYWHLAIHPLFYCLYVSLDPFLLGRWEVLCLGDLHGISEDRGAAGAILLQLHLRQKSQQS